MKQKTFYLESLGCAKNTVDSDSMSALMQQAGYRAVAKPSQAEVLIVNTCGFIAAAREESFGVLRELAEQKRPGQKLIAAGCLTERYRQAVVEQVPGIDGILSTRRWMDILEIVEKLQQRAQPCPLPAAGSTGSQPGRKRCPAGCRSGQQCLSQDRRWLPARLCFLRHSADQGTGGQPDSRRHPGRSSQPGCWWHPRTDLDRPGYNRLRL